MMHSLNISSFGNSPAWPSLCLSNQGSEDQTNCTRTLARSVGTLREIDDLFATKVSSGILFGSLQLANRKANLMHHEAEDRSVLKSVRQLAEEEHRLYSHEALTDADRARLAKINVELD